jgi:hypothetical protein
MKILKVQLLSMLLGFASCASMADSAPTSKHTGKSVADVCQALRGQRTAYLLVDPTGTIAPAMRNRAIPAEAVTLSADEVELDTGHQLLVSRPGKLTFSSPDFVFHPVKARCPGASEYRIAYRASTRVASSLVTGLKSSVPLLVEGPGDSDQWDVAVHADLAVVSPLAAVDEGGHPALAKLMRDATPVAALVLRNQGNAALNIVGVTTEQKSGHWYQIDSSNCMKRAVPPAGSCAISLTRLSGSREKERVDTITLKSNDRLGHPTIHIVWDAPTGPELVFRRD